MKEILVISGKGGTGKTVITGALAELAKNKIMVDCDVDAANLHLILNPQIKEKKDFIGSAIAIIDQNTCSKCGKCVEVCRFDAINNINNNYLLNMLKCEGCGLCYLVCPSNAIRMQKDISGEWFVSETDFGTFVHAKLGIAKENSGKLVTQIKQKAKEIAKEQNSDWIIIDGAPGIGCPVIASLSGIDCAIIVTEPTLSGLHDATRIIKVAKQFNVPVKMIINKYDINPEMTEKIEEYCKNNKIPLIGKIKFDKTIVDAVVQRKTILNNSTDKTRDEIINIWQNITKTVR